jgi:hypothetical protein
MAMTEPMDDDDDELDWDEWMSMSDAEHEAILDREMAEYSQWFNALTPLQQYRHRRQRGVRTCLGWRRIIRKLDLQVIRDHLRTSQRLLLKMRADFYHGVQGGVQ